MAVGSSREKLGPTAMRAICGMTRPTQPMMPETATALAVISVAAPITRSRRHPASTPSALAGGKDVDAPAQQDQRHQADEDQRRRGERIALADGREVSKQPEHDRWQ